MTRGLTLEQMIYARKNHKKKTLLEIANDLNVSVDRVKWFCRGYICSRRGTSTKYLKNLTPIGRFKYVMSGIGISFEKMNYKKPTPVKPKGVQKKKLPVSSVKDIDYDKLREYILKKEGKYYDLPINDELKTERPKPEYTQSASPYGIANELHGVKIAS